MSKQARSSIALWCLICLFAASSGMADSADPADDTAINGTLIALNMTEQSDGPHTLDEGDINDWFKCVLTAGIPYRFESIGGSDTKAFLFADPSEITQRAVDDQSGTNNNFKLRFLPTVTATNYLKVQSFPVGFNATYTLQYSIYSADEWDPSDDVGTNGTVLTMGAAPKVQGPHRLDNWDEFDWFRIDLSSDVAYRFESLGNADVYGELYSDPEAGTLIEDDDSGDNLNFSFDYTPTNTATYYIRIWKYNTEAQYDLRYLPVNGAVEDADGDGMPDAWEIQYFGSTNAMPDDLTGDSDSFSNIEEYIAGTDPTDSDSYFAVTNWSTGSFVIEWAAFSNREYQVYRADSLTNTFNPIGPVVLYPQNSYTDTVHAAEDSGFYKVEVQLQ